MKSVFLILYLWHADAQIVSGYVEKAMGMNGGPVLRIERMESLKQCEAVGQAVKLVVDLQPEAKRAAVYRCVEVAK